MTAQSDILLSSPKLRQELISGLCADEFEEFIRRTQPDYFFNWHHLVLIDALQRLAQREYRRLIVMMPPRHGKSRLVSTLFPAWCLGRNANEQIITASYSAQLASFFNRQCQRLILSDEYKEIFPNVRLNETGRNEVGAVRNNSEFDVLNAKGHYISTGIGGGLTGRGATVAIIDDPVKNSEEADSLTRRDSIWEWYSTTFQSRFEPGCIEIICQTRWHEDDLTGRILEQIKTDGEETEIISFPALAEHDEDHRKTGEALWPQKRSRRELLKVQKDSGSRAWSALYQQRPTPDEGAVLKKEWFGEYEIKDILLSQEPRNFFFDTAYTKEEKNDPTAGIAYIKRGADFYVLECVSVWQDFSGQTQFIKEFTARNGYSRQSKVRVEPKATGKSVVQVLKAATSLNIFEATPPKESKQSRVNSVVPTVQAGRVFLPKGMAWVADFLIECASFPNGANDDRVDCLCGMILSENEQRRQFKRPSLTFDNL